MTSTSDGPLDSGLWMTVDDIFHIQGRGTVVTGQLQGDGEVHVGDHLLIDGQSWRISAIEMFRATMMSASSGMNVGLLLGKGPKADALRGRTVRFDSKSSGPMGPVNPQFTVVEPKKRPWRR
jgi:translation elongation factor EF-Tu-like GTPase